MYSIIAIHKDLFSNLILTIQALKIRNTNITNVKTLCYLHTFFLQTKLQGKTGKNIKIRHFFHTKRETFSILLMDFWQEEKKKKKIAYLSKPPFCHQAQSSSHNVLLLGLWMNVLSKVKITHFSILSIFFKSVHFSQFNLVFFSVTTIPSINNNRIM